MTDIEWTPKIKAAALVGAFRGWNDGGEAATGAVEFMRDLFQLERFARIDPDDYFDFQINRPLVHLVEGRTRSIHWPSNEFYASRSGSPPIVLVLGTEPSLRWRSFCDAILDVARSLGIEKVATLGAFLADVPHARESPITGSAGNSQIAENLGLIPSRYEGPTGIVGVLHGAATSAGLESASLWAAVPHYLGNRPNPRATRALLTKLGQFLGVEIDTQLLKDSEPDWDRQVADAITADPDLAAYVEKLESAYPSDELLTALDTSGDSLAAELEEFLRQQRGEGA